MVNVFHHPRWRVEFGKRPEFGEDLLGGCSLAGTVRACLEVSAKIPGDRSIELIVEQGIDEIECRLAAQWLNR